MEDFASLLEGKLIQLIYILSINQFSISDWMHKYRPLPATKPLKLRNLTIACGPHRARIGNLENIVTWGDHMSKSSTSHGTVVLCCSSSQLWSCSVVQSLPGWRYSKSWSWPQPLPELPVMSEENKVALIVEGDCPRSQHTNTSQEPELQFFLRNFQGSSHLVLVTCMQVAIHQSKSPKDQQKETCPIPKVMFPMACHGTFPSFWTNQHGGNTVLLPSKSGLAGLCWSKPE